MVNKIAAVICCNDTKSQTLASLMQLAYSRVICGWTATGLGLLPFIRNQAIISTYAGQPDFTHLLFIDDDMANFNEDHVLALAELDKPIVSGVITSRLPPYKIISSINDCTPDEIMTHLKDQTIFEEDHVGMAFTLIKREVLDVLRQPADIWFTMDRMPRQAFMKETQTFIEGLVDSTKPEIERYREAVAWGRLSHVGAELIGEDVEFCRRARAFGFKSYTHCGVIVGHIGTQPYTVRESLIYRMENRQSCLKVSLPNTDQVSVP